MTAETQSPILRSASSNIVDLLRQGYRRVCFGYCVPTGVISSWVSCGPSFQLQYDIETDIGLDKLVYWWLRHGRHTFEGLSAAIDPHFLFETHLSILAEDKNFVPNSPLFQIIQRHREDITDLHDISTQEGILAFWNWWLQFGRAEYFGDLNWFQTQEIVNVLNSALNDGENASDLVVDGIRYLQLVYLKTCILDETGPVSDLVNRLHFAFLHNGFVSPTPLQWIIYRNRADLRATMDLNTHEGVFAFWTWWVSHGHDEYLGGAVWIKQKQAFFLLDSLEHEADTWDVFRHEALSQIKTILTNDDCSPRNLFNG
ncbi:hypothetical protein, partial [Rhizobium dioscoreae]